MTKPNGIIAKHANPNNGREAIIHWIHDQYRVELFENGVFTHVRYIKDHSEAYCEDLAENWVLEYGEFSKKGSVGIF